MASVRRLTENSSQCCPNGVTGLLSSLRLTSVIALFSLKSRPRITFVKLELLEFGSTSFPYVPLSPPSGLAACSTYSNTGDLWTGLIPFFSALFLRLPFFDKFWLIISIKDLAEEPVSVFFKMADAGSNLDKALMSEDELSDSDSVSSFILDRLVVAPILEVSYLEEWSWLILSELRSTELSLSSSSVTASSLSVFNVVCAALKVDLGR